MHDESPDGEEFDLEIDWEVNPVHLYLVHVLSERAWDIDGVLRYPTPAEIKEKVREMIEALRELGGGIYLTLNGFKVYTDPEFPDSYEIYFKVGHASPRIPEGSH